MKHTSNKCEGSGSGRGSDETNAMMRESTESSGAYAKARGGACFPCSTCCNCFLVSVSPAIFTTAVESAEVDAVAEEAGADEEDALALVDTAAPGVDALPLLAARNLAARPPGGKRCFEAGVSVAASELLLLVGGGGFCVDADGCAAGTGAETEVVELDKELTDGRGDNLEATDWVPVAAGTVAVGMIRLDVDGADSKEIELRTSPPTLPVLACEEEGRVAASAGGGVVTVAEAVALTSAAALAPLLRGDTVAAASARLASRCDCEVCSAAGSRDGGGGATNGGATAA
jgi:hypothetical protein